MTNLLTLKLLRDLRANRSRFVLMVIAIAVSLTVFGGVLFAWSASGRETSAGYMATEPASATVLLDMPVDANRMTAIVAEAGRQPGVIAATGRTQFDSDVEVNSQARDIPLQVFVATPDDPMRMARIQRRQGTWPPAPGEILLGRDTLSLLDVAVGDTITVEPPGAEPLRLRVAGTVYDPSLAPAPQEQRGHAYLSTTSLGLDQLKIQVAQPGQATSSHDREAVVAVASSLGQWLQREQGLAIREIQVPEPYAHPHQWQADALLLSLLAGGAAALLLSTILVATMLNNLFTQQIPQIGIMKTIGAPSRRIGRLYLATTLLVAAAATLLALAPAILIGRLGVANFMGFLGIEPVSLAAPAWTYPVILAAGLLLPPLMALLPLIKASRTTVRSAIDHHGVGAKPATGILTRFGGLNRGLLMALRNMIRRPARFALSVSLLACAGMVFVAGMSLSSGVQAVEEEQNAARTWDVDVQLAKPAPMADIPTTPGISRIEGFAVAQTGVAGPGRIPLTRTYPDQGHGRVTVTAIPPDATTFATPTLIEGRWLNPGETGAIVLNQITRDNTVPNTHAGDTVELSVGGKATTWQVVGIAEEKGHGSGAYTTAEGFAAATGQPPQVTQLRITTTSHDEPTRTATAEAISKSLTAQGIEVKSATSISRGEAITAGHLGPIVLIVLVIAIAMGLVGGIGLASTMSANILDRTREFGVMHAIGARPRTVRRIVVAEGILLALTSCVVAILPALALTGVLGAGLGDLFFSAPLPYRISLLGVGIWSVLAVVGAALATGTAATRASRITVREALTYV